MKRQKEPAKRGPPFRRDNDALERRVLARLRRKPASFKDLIEEGLLTHGSANTMRHRLKGRLVCYGYRPSSSGRGRPHVLWVAPPSR